MFVCDFVSSHIQIFCITYYVVAIFTSLELYQVSMFRKIGEEWFRKATTGECTVIRIYYWNI